MHSGRQWPRLKENKSICDKFLCVVQSWSSINNHTLGCALTWTHDCTHKDHGVVLDLRCALLVWQKLMEHLHQAGTHEVLLCRTWEGQTAPSWLPYANPLIYKFLDRHSKSNQETQWSLLHRNSSIIGIFWGSVGLAWVLGITTLTQVQSCNEAQGNQGFILHDHVLAGCHGDQVLHSASLDNCPDYILQSIK